MYILPTLQNMAEKSMLGEGALIAGEAGVAAYLANRLGCPDCPFPPPCPPGPITPQATTLEAGETITGTSGAAVSLDVMASQIAAEAAMLFVI